MADKRSSKAQHGETPAPKRPDKYSRGFAASYCDVVHKLALLGLTLEQCAKVLDVAPRTLDNWIQQHEAFAEAWRTGAEQADSRVAASLFQRAIGYSHPDVDIRVCNGEIVQTPITKHYPPDTTACIFWLKNRQFRLWRDRIDARLVDEDGKDVQRLDDHEVARRLCFLLAQADQKNPPATGAAHATH